MPVAMPASSSTSTSSSVATLPAAPAANGEPPRPPSELSSRVTPHSIAAQALSRPVPRVSWKWTPTVAPEPLDQRGDARRRRHPGRVGDGDARGAGGDRGVAAPLDLCERDLALVRRAEGARDHDVDRHAGAARRRCAARGRCVARRRRAARLGRERADRRQPGERLRPLHPRVAAAVLLRRRHRHRERVDAGRERVARAALVRHQRGADDARQLAQGGDQRRGAGHRRHRLRRDERGDLDLAHAGCRQRADQLDPPRDAAAAARPAARRAGRRRGS